MNTAVRFYSRSGNTRSIAISIGQAIHAEALPVFDPLTEYVDLLFLGGAMYAFHLGRPLRKFIRCLYPEMVGAIAPFSTSGNSSGASKLIEKACQRCGLYVLNAEFHCTDKEAKTVQATEEAAKFAQRIVADLED